MFDTERQALVWTPGFAAAGTYPNVKLAVTDGIETASRSFTLVVAPVNQPPTLVVPADRTIREGDPLRLVLRATDPEGDALVFSSRFLPGGSSLDRETGVFEWTPSFTQAGTYHVPFTVSDGLGSTSKTVTLTVLNVNGAPVFDDLGTWEAQEGVNASFRAF